jgi:hypothetical protein
MGLWLGSTEAQVATTLGVPSHRGAGWMFYEFSGKSPGKCEGGYFDVVNELQVHIERGLVTDLRISQVTSC